MLYNGIVLLGVTSIGQLLSSSTPWLASHIHCCYGAVCTSLAQGLSTMQFCSNNYATFEQLER